MVDTAKPKPENKTAVLARVETSVCGLVLNTLEDMKTVAQLILQSKLAPPSFDSAEKIFVGLQTGAEIGLKPMQSLNSIVVINGKPTLWGDAALALVKKSGLSEYCNEYFELHGEKVSEKDVQYATIDLYPDDLVAVCETKRKGEDEPVIRYFSVADAKLARLWKKAGPWTTHPKRMLKYKARAFNLRDNFPDVLFGMHLAEELYGEEPLPAPESDVLPRDKRRSLAVPSTTLDGSRKPVQEAELTPESKERIAAAADGDMVPVDYVGEKKPESELVTFKCNKCSRTYQYGEEAGKDVKCECGEGVLVLESAEPAATEPSWEEKGDMAALYVEVSDLYAAQNGQDFTEFASYVLCLDESEVDAPSKFTEEQLKQIKAYIETSGVAIN